MHQFSASQQRIFTGAVHSAVFRSTWVQSKSITHKVLVPVMPIGSSEFVGSAEMALNALNARLEDVKRHLPHAVAKYSVRALSSYLI